MTKLTLTVHRERRGIVFETDLAVVLHTLHFMSIVLPHMEEMPK